MILQIKCLPKAQGAVIDFLRRLHLRPLVVPNLLGIILAEIPEEDRGRMKRNAVKLWWIPGVQEVTKIKKRTGGNGKVIPISSSKPKPPKQISFGLP